MDFAVNTISFLNNLPFHREYDVFRNQLSKAVTSIGANYEESQASSYREFRQRIRICLREAREANYWIRLLNKLMSKNNNFTRYHNVESSETLTELEKESGEILLIFGSISSKINKRLKQSPLTK